MIRDMAARIISLVFACALAIVALGCAFGPRASVWAAGGLVAAGFLALCNTMPWLYRADAYYVEPENAAVRWPEARTLRSFKGNDRLLFCLHGFPSTPADFRKVEAVATERGWDLFAPLLPGCGTDPEDIKSTNWAQFIACARDHWMEQRPLYRRVCLVGSSVGGSFCLSLAREFCADPALAPGAVATIGSPAVLNAFLRYGLVRSPLLYAARFLGAFIPSLGAGLPDPARPGEDGDGDWKGYLGVYPRQAYSLQVGLREMERNLGAVTCPALICHATSDRVVSFANAAIIAGGLGSDRIEAYIANMNAFGHARHNLLLYDSQRDRVWKRILDFFDDVGSDHAESG